MVIAKSRSDSKGCSASAQAPGAGYPRVSVLFHRPELPTDYLQNEILEMVREDGKEHLAASEGNNVLQQSRRCASASSICGRQNRMEDLQ
ncbi:hypothetical protein Taro_011891 [Colocasia esculenta]|uniref:Uncharacterized protein n=1 Tax=Colocasia esculenta TaxID=4460 RepID=A0A843U7L2_COLES|nr:hypothetical protein [Colocasia esculenta]